MENKRYRILFVCIHNSARSQMAEAFLNELGNELFEAESAGLEPGKLNPAVVAVMAQIGMDISKNKTTGVIDLLRQGEHYDAIITVCDAASAEKCPVFPGKAKRIAWSFSDPSAFKGTPEQVMEQTRQVRDAIKQKVVEFTREAGSIEFWV